MDLNSARLQMVKNQLIPNKISESNLIDIILKTKKEDFLPDKLKANTYIDNEIMIKPSRYYLSNLHMAQILQSAEIKNSDKILHLGTLTGYLTYILSNLSSNVIGIEFDEELFNISKNNLKNLKIENIQLINSNVEIGFESKKPFDVIIIDSCIEEIPDSLLEQLSEINGRLITIEKINNNLSNGIKLIRNNSSFHKEILFNSFTQSSYAFKREQKFVF
ncbi:MAG: Protein-L-isoaspartate O-methyltransferase [Alphaproteobacteria bacterium MarineAlpha5_Bin11]|nr:hypothetical protein [Pelagibacteraceae bacterium]PPR42997.1 MAG: Protein-L-isoaspartate O-methyltransferase [Alphaproteobacteria bacterium MarineAlpha5_Bin11]|tara:strand:- start:33680 stop:34336 length:657 start_codon:yes stop_codon:yes gene_type:complete